MAPLGSEDQRGVASVTLEVNRHGGLGDQHLRYVVVVVEDCSGEGREHLSVVVACVGGIQRRYELVLLVVFVNEQ